MARNRLFIFILLITYCPLLNAQNEDSALANDELSFSDSLSIFQLIDSLLAIEDATRSQLAFRLNYNSNVLSAGRSLGIEQFGLSPGLSYFHKTGFYADITTYWSQDFNPQFYLTTLSAGYMHIFSRYFSIMSNYDRYFYNFGEDSYIPYFNSLSFTPFLDIGPVTLRVDYSLYFGDATAHRIMPGLSINLRKKKIWGIDRIAFSPGAYILFGDETVSEVNIKLPTSKIELLENILKYGTRYQTEIIDHQIFGVMNYAFSFPVSITVKNWVFTAAYTYSIPKALDNEPLNIPETGYLSAGLMYTLNLKSKNTL